MFAYDLTERKRGSFFRQSDFGNHYKMPLQKN
jgi:hypothetical protein